MRYAALAARRAAFPAGGGLSVRHRAAADHSADVRTWDSRAGCADTTTGLSASRRSLQLLAVDCGSRSTIAVTFPASCAATASASVRVVLPVPPFWAMTAMTSMGGILLASL